MKNKTTTKQKVWTSGISPTTNLSYEKYLKAGLENISSKLSVRVYKLAPKAEYPMFERGKDLRVRVFWKNEFKYEFLIEKTFFYQSNRNKEDRTWMRNWANPKLKMFHDAVELGKKKIKKKK